jgi:very-short-patch-repair endonuclease
VEEKPPAISRVRRAGPRRKPKPGRSREQTLFAQKLRHEVSKTEKRLWPRLRDSQLGAPFRRQHVIGQDFTDYCCVPLGLVVEIDGPQHDLARDAAKDARLKQQGFDVVRFGVQEVDQNFEGVISTVHDAVQLRLMAKASGGTR